jgi:hypothetical protein
MVVPEPWEPPTKLDRYCDKASKRLLNVLILLLAVQSLWMTYMVGPMRYEIIP